MGFCKPRSNFRISRQRLNDRQMENSQAPPHRSSRARITGSSPIATAIQRWCGGCTANWNNIACLNAFWANRARDRCNPAAATAYFLDREELPSSANLSTPIHETLSHSYTLIAACSPYSAVSRWVNGEVQYFKQIGKADRVMLVILDGEPNATDKPQLASRSASVPRCAMQWTRKAA